MNNSPSPQTLKLPSKAEPTSSRRQSIVDVFAKTEKLYPSIYYQLKYKPFKWVKQLNETTYIVNPSNRYRRIQNRIKQHLERVDVPNKYSLHGIQDGFKQLTRLRGFFDLLVVDVRHCFESITFTRVCGLMRSRDLRPANEWAKYACFNGSLMRGSTCSNQILESLFIRLDYRLAGICKPLSFFYKRYVDEMWFYGDFAHKNLNTFLFDVKKVIAHEGFRLNNNKTYIEFRSEFETLEDDWHRPNQSRVDISRSK
jgi:hypothetical protein